jgi:hypothetical protein
VEIRHLDLPFLADEKPDPCGARVCEQCRVNLSAFLHVAPEQVDGRFVKFFWDFAGVSSGLEALLLSGHHIPGI